MIHTTLLVFAISIYVASVAFLYLKDFLPACNGVQIDVKLEDSNDNTLAQNSQYDRRQQQIFSQQQYRPKSYSI